jgi:hypothetical protein
VLIHVISDYLVDFAQHQRDSDETLDIIHTDSSTFEVASLNHGTDGVFNVGCRCASFQRGLADPATVPSEGMEKINIFIVVLENWNWNG